MSRAACRTAPDEVLKLTSRDLDPDPSVWVGPHLALSPDETHPMAELPEPGVLARAVLPQARPAAADGDLQFDKSLARLVDGADPGDRAGIVAEGIRRVDHAVHSAWRADRGPEAAQQHDQLLRRSWAGRLRPACPQVSWYAELTASDRWLPGLTPDRARNGHVHGSGLRPSDLANLCTLPAWIRSLISRTAEIIPETG